MDLVREALAFPNEGKVSCYPAPRKRGRFVNSQKLTVAMNMATIAARRFVASVCAVELVSFSRTSAPCAGPDMPHKCCHHRRPRGLPVRPDRINKDRMSGVLPPPDAYLGRLQLFKPSTARVYAERLLSEKPRKLVGSRSGRLDETDAAEVA